MKIHYFIPFLAMLFFGCETPNVGTRVQSYPSTQVFPSQKLIEEKFEILSANSKRQNDLLQVQVNGFNGSNESMALVYRFRWLDGDGMQVGVSNELWKETQVNPMDNAYFSGVAPTPSIANYELYVRLK